MTEDKPGRPSNDAAAIINGAYAVPFPETGTPISDPVAVYMIQEFPLPPSLPYVPSTWITTITPEMIRQIIREELERLLPKRKRR